MMLTKYPHSGTAALLKSGTAIVAVAMLLSSLPAVGHAQSSDTPLVSGAQAASISGITEADVQQLGRDLDATPDLVEGARQAEQADREAAAEERQRARDTLDTFGSNDQTDRGDGEVARGGSGSGSAAGDGNGGLDGAILRPVDGTAGAGMPAMAQAGLTSFSANIPEPPPSPFDNPGPAVGSGNVFLEPDPLTNRRLSPPVFEDPTLIEKAPRPTEITRTVHGRRGSLSGVDAKDLRLRAQPYAASARGLNCSPPDLRLEELDFSDRPNTYRLTGKLETPTDGYTYEVQPTDQRNSFIQVSGGPSLMGMTLSMKEPEMGYHTPDGQVKINELVTVAPNTLRLDVLVNNVIFRRAKMYYCRIPGTLD